MKRLFERYTYNLKFKPLRTKISTNVVIICISDFIIQYYESISEKKKFQLDKTRNFKLSMFGVPGASWLHVHYSIILPKIGLQGLRFHIFFFFYNILFQIPSFSVMFTVYTNYLWNENPTIEESIKKFKMLTKTAYMFWPILNSVIFHFTPHYYVPLVTNVCSLFWNMLVSRLNKILSIKVVDPINSEFYL